MIKIEKYLKNQDITLTNDDIDTERLIKDLQNGMISENEVNSRIESAVKSSTDEASKKYAELESKYNDLEKRNGDLTTSNAQLKLENVMTQEGFKQDQFKEVAQMRATLFADEKDDRVAVQGIKEKFKSTYFPQENKPVITEVPNEPPVQSKNAQEKPIVVNRNTRVSSLFIKK